MKSFAGKHFIKKDAVNKIIKSKPSFKVGKCVILCEEMGNGVTLYK